MENQYQLNRTIAIVRELAKGKTLKLSIGELGMSEDMSIGFVMKNSEGETSISGLSTMDLKELNVLLEKESIGFVVP